MKMSIQFQVTELEGRKRYFVWTFIYHPQPASGAVAFALVSSQNALLQFVPLLLGTFANLRKATVSFVVYVRLSAGNNWTPTGRILIKFDI